MVGSVGERPIIGRVDPRRVVARLAAAVMVADDRITESEVSAVERLERLGLGPLTSLVEAEIERATREPIDLAAAINELGEIGPEAAALLVSGLAEIATSDRALAPREVEVLGAIAAGLGLRETETAQLIRSAAAGLLPSPGARTAPTPNLGPATPRAAVVPPPPAPAHAPERTGADAELAWAFHVLGLAPGDSAEQAEAAYVALVRRYNPVAVLDLGTEFTMLAVQKLSAATTAYIAARDALAPR